MAASKEVAEAVPGMNVAGIAKADELNAIESVADALALIGIDKLTEENAALLDWDTNPFEVVDKSRLIGIPLFLVQWTFRDGDITEYVIVHAIAQLDNGTEWFVLFTDGSHGIKEQLNTLTNKRIAEEHAHPQQGARVRGGLSPSDYEVEGPDGKMIPARTYYLSNTVKKAA